MVDLFINNHVQGKKFVLYKVHLYFTFPDGATEVKVEYTQHSYTLVELSNAHLTIKPEGSCHDNRFKTLDEALERAVETYEGVYGDD